MSETMLELGHYVLDLLPDSIRLGHGVWNCPEFGQHV